MWMTDLYLDSELKDVKEYKNYTRTITAHEYTELLEELKLARAGIAEIRKVKEHYNESWNPRVIPGLYLDAPLKAYDDAKKKAGG